MQDLPLILTLQLDAASFGTLDRLRQAHFPAHRNFLPAHITLFHAIPFVHEAKVREVVRAAANQTPVLPLELPEVRFLGSGVAVEVSSADLLQLRAGLATAFSAWLSVQDRQGYRPHVTIQNKTSPALARGLYEAMRHSWAPMCAHGEGLLLWQYQGGPWKWLESFSFAGA